MASFEAAHGAGIINWTLARFTGLFFGRGAANLSMLPIRGGAQGFIGAGFQLIDPSSIKWVDYAPPVTGFQFQPIDLSAAPNRRFKPVTPLRQLGPATNYKWSPPARWVEDTQQARVDSFPAEIQKQASMLYEATLRGSIMHEYWSIILVLEDGSAIPLLDATDKNPDHVSLPENAAKLRDGAIEEARKIAAVRPELFKGTVRIVSLHTHPTHPDTYYERTADGSYYTGLSNDDYLTAKGVFTFNLKRRLRAAGFSGRIESLDGALPVTRDPLPRGVADSIYVVFYFQWVARVHGYLARANN